MDIPEELITLERTAEEARARLAGLAGADYDTQWLAWRGAVGAFQAAVTEYVRREDVGLSWSEAERAARRAVRCGQEDPAG